MSFEVIPLGVYGGVCSGNLSSYLVKHEQSPHYLLLDAGTLFQGILCAQQNKALPQTPTPQAFVDNHVGACLLTHAHLDHIFGIAVGTTELTRTLPVHALPCTINQLKQHIFNDTIWPNLIKYNQISTHAITPRRPFIIPNTSYSVQAFPLQHGAVESTAYLISVDNDSVLFLGDTGDDAIEHSDYLAQLWQHTAPLVEQGSLQGIFIEASYQNSQSNDQLYGHLTPRLVISNMRTLRQQLINRDALTAVTVFITHIKPAFHSLLNRQPEIIQAEISDLRPWVKNVILPEQGKRYLF